MDTDTLIAYELAESYAAQTEAVYQGTQDETEEQQHIDAACELKVGAAVSVRHSYGDRDQWRPLNPQDPWSPLVNREGFTPAGELVVNR